MRTTKTIKVSFFEAGVFNTTPTDLLSIEEVFEIVRGTGKLSTKKQTGGLRMIYDDDPKKQKKARNEFKKQSFPQVCFGGEFRKKNNEEVINPSNCVILDFDKVGTIAQVKDLKNRLSEDQELDAILLFISPSGDGVKAVVNVRQPITNDDDNKTAFKSLKNYLDSTYNLPTGVLDEAGKDISRGCYIPYDPEAILNEIGEGFDVEKWKPVEIPQAPIDNRPLREKFNLSDDLSDYDRTEKAVEDIERSGISVAEDRQDWLFFCFELSNLGESGRDLFHRVARCAPNYDQRSTDNTFTKTLRSNRSGRNLESFFTHAAQKGVTLRPSISTPLNGAKTSIKQNPQSVGATMETKKQSQTQATDQGQIPVDPEDQIRKDYDFILRAKTRQEIFDEESMLPEGLMSGYRICDDGGESPDGSGQSILLGAGVLTGIVAPTNHGKTTFLLNMLLNVARLNPDRRFVFFTYEENSNRVIEYLLNIYLEDMDLGKYDSNRRLLKKYFKSKGNDTRFFYQDKISEFEKRVDLFFKTYIESGQILIKYVDYDSDRLCANIARLSENYDIGGVFVDYFQYINAPQRSNRTSRVEELKSICIQLKDVANKTGYPIVLACQFNQEVISPLDVKITKVGEAGDISRIMSELYGIWNLDKEVGRDLGKQEDQVKKIYAIGGGPNVLEGVIGDYNGDDPNITGIYIKILKSRELRTGNWSVLKHRGNNTKIYPNDDRATIPLIPNLLIPDWDLDEIPERHEYDGSPF